MTSWRTARCESGRGSRHYSRMRTLAAASMLLIVSVAAGIASGHAVKGAPRCPVFPKNNPWNQRVDKLPLVSNSDAIVRSIGSGAGVHPDFGSGLYDGAPIGIPFVTVAHAQKKVRASFDYSDEADNGRYP